MHLTLYLSKYQSVLTEVSKSFSNDRCLKMMPANLYELCCRRVFQMDGYRIERLTLPTSVKYDVVDSHINGNNHVYYSPRGLPSPKIKSFFKDKIPVFCKQCADRVKCYYGKPATNLPLFSIDITRLYCAMCVKPLAKCEPVSCDCFPRGYFPIK